MILLIRAQASYCTMYNDMERAPKTKYYISKLYKYEDWNNKNVKMLVRAREFAYRSKKFAPIDSLPHNTLYCTPKQFKYEYQKRKTCMKMLMQARGYQVKVHLNCKIGLPDPKTIAKTRRSLPSDYYNYKSVKMIVHARPPSVGF